MISATRSSMRTRRIMNNPWVICENSTDCARACRYGRPHRARPLSNTVSTFRRVGCPRLRGGPWVQKPGGALLHEGTTNRRLLTSEEKLVQLGLPGTDGAIHFWDETAEVTTTNIVLDYPVKRRNPKKPVKKAISPPPTRYDLLKRG